MTRPRVRELFREDKLLYLAPVPGYPRILVPGTKFSTAVILPVLAGNYSRFDFEDRRTAVLLIVP